MTDDLDLSVLYGPLAPYSEHKRGEMIRFIDAAGQAKQGEILWVRSPGRVVESGKEHPIVYIVDTGEGWPCAVYPGQIVSKNDGS